MTVWLVGYDAAGVDTLMRGRMMPSGVWAEGVGSKGLEGWVGGKERGYENEGMYLCCM